MRFPTAACKDVVYRTECWVAPSAQRSDDDPAFRAGG